MRALVLFVLSFMLIGHAHAADDGDMEASSDSTSEAKPDSEQTEAEDGPAPAEAEEAPEQSGEDDPQEASEPSQGETDGGEDPVTAPPLSEEPDIGPPAPRDATPAPEPSVDAVRVYTTGRVGAGVFVGDGLVVTLYELVRIGGRTTVTTEDGARTDASIVAFDAASGLALLKLDDQVEQGTVPRPRPMLRAAELGEEVRWIGHGGTPRLGGFDEGLMELARFSPLPARVVAVPEAVEADDLDDFLIDRPPGEGDRGAPVFGDDGALLGVLDQPLEGGGGRSRVISARRVEELLDGPRLEGPYRKRTHLQFWSGIGIAAHNQPTHLAGTASIGFRVAVLDHLRIEPWFEGLAGFRSAFSDEDEDGNILDSRPTDFWWSIETGISIGYRAPLPNPTSRDYLVPNVGLRLGWNNFVHQESALVSDCSTDPCSYALEQTPDRVRQFRPGVDLGFDVRHGKVRVGYRFFLDPTALAAHSMHRVFVTIDGFPLPIGVGDTH